MNKVLMLMRRELWENRSLWIAPLVVAGVLLLAAAAGNVHMQSDGESPFSGAFAVLNAILKQPEIGYISAMGVFTVLQFFVLGFVVFFYLLDSLLGERKDRSILFWKSLPISDAQVVASKALIALVVAPLIALVVTAASQLLFGVIWAIRGSGDTGVVPFDASMWFQLQVGSLMMAFLTIVWYLPLAGYFLLVSVWSRRNAFLWAILPIIGILAVDGLILHTEQASRFLVDRFAGHYIAMAAETPHFEFHSVLGFIANRVGLVFKQPTIWLGIAAAAGMFFAIVRIRRYRDDS
jgi:ABC-2 type transport system permease protein